MAAALLGMACVRVPPPPAPPVEPPRHFLVYSLWLEGQGEQDRPELDAFLDCLLHGSTFEAFWDGRVSLEAAGSWVVEAPEGRLNIGEASEAWLSPMLTAGDIPAPPAGVTPIYLVYAGVAQMERAACGHCGAVEVGRRAAGLAVVRTGPPCWPAQGAVRSLTQFTQHELSCALELSLGEDHCAADGKCEGRATCVDICDSFTGLYCAGAPEQSYTGCNGTPVRGWVVQKLSHRGEGTDTCDLCAPCDFTVEPTGPADR